MPDKSRWIPDCWILELLLLTLAMENSYHSSWPDAENWADFSAAPSNESSFIVPWPIEPHFSASSSVKCHDFPLWAIPTEVVAEDRATTVSKSHRQAEKRRRDRINAQLAALRKLIPMSDKMDKAALLGSAIEHVKDLKRKATEISKAFNIPTEIDEVTVDCDLPEDISPTNTNQSKDKIFIRASVCCDDRPGVFAEVLRVLKGLRLSTVKADISSVGGRMKSNLILCNENSDEDQSVSPSTLKQSLDVVLSRIASSSTGSNCRIRSKRQRLFLPSQFTR
ncbi:transcription factor bHLH51-like [Durio zibethinus]|uniref:Transcription factor bHLH51-like n=1 Tax=Durio zibethinus TaxID=66656 RepID=A0A6P5YW59_DURZI|nr:transcription factor bHLH51-like [Durio zibethinus]